MIYHAIIGCGRVAENHADAFLRLDGVRIKYAVDIIEENAKTFASKFSIPNAVSDFESILKDPELTSISLAVPHFLHGSMAVQAIKAGKHVLIEKPVVMRRAEGELLHQAAVQAGVVVLPVVQHRFDKIVGEIKSLVDSGELGAIRFVRSHLECFRTPSYYSDSEWRGKKDKEGGSVLINQAYHLLDLMLYLAGTVDNVTCSMNTFQKDIMETEDVLSATLHFSNGAIGALSICGAGGSTWSSYIELIGEKGLVAFDINFPNQLHRFQLNSKRMMKEWRERLREALPDPQNLPGGINYYGTSHREQAADFIAEIRNEKTTSGATLEHALYVVEIIEKIYRSSEIKLKSSQND